jgi:Flp pilus assembly protein TadD
MNPKDSANTHKEKEQLALALINQGKLKEAENIYTILVNSGSINDIVHGNLGALLQRKGDVTNATLLLKKSLDLNPNNADVHNNLGIAFEDQGDLSSAINSFNQAIELKLNFPEAHYNLGNALKKKGDLTAAIASYQTALQLKFNYPEAHYNLGNALKKKGDLTAAITSYQTALQLKPNYPEAHYNLGNSLKDRGDLTAAIIAYNTAIQLKPSFPEAHYNLGNSLTDRGDLTAAITAYNTAIQLEPNYPEAHSNLGNVLKDNGDIKAAISSFNKSLEITPDDPGAHFNLSLAILTSGDYKNGWEEYEWRTEKMKGKSRLHAIPNCSLWQGKPPKPKTKLLLVTEQGLGDTLQFLRYARALKDQNFNVSLCAPIRLHLLIQASNIHPSPLTPEQANQVKDGQWSPLLSIPKYLKVTPSNPIITEPYIKSTDELNAKWKNILLPRYNPIIGINWRGNSNDKSRQNRNIKIHTFKRALDAISGNFICLQRDAHFKEIENVKRNPNITNKQLEISRIADSNDPEDFLEYAAIIANCDLVITTGSTVAHLAAGMGIPTWVLLPKVPDWRWGLEGDTTFWYPSIRLFRQRERGNWDEVMERVAEALQKDFGERPSPRKLA